MRGLLQVLSLFKAKLGYKGKGEKVHSAVLTSHDMLMLLELDARLERCLGIMKRTAFT